MSRLVSSYTLLGAVLLAAAPRSQQPAADKASAGERAREFLERCESFGFSGAVLVERDGEVLVRDAYGYADRDANASNEVTTLFDIGSLTKQFTAAAILRLEQQGALATSDKLGKFFEDTPPDKADIEIHHLLTHTSGLPRGSRSVGSGLHDRDELVKILLGLPLQAKPGERHAYSNIGYGLLGVIVELASNRPFEDYLRTELFEPAGMADTGFRRDGRLDPARAAKGHASLGVSLPGSAIQGETESPYEKRLATDGWYSWGLRGAGGVITTIDDLRRWGHALAGDEILTPASKTKLWTPALDNYAYGWFVLKTKRGTTWIEHGGSTGNGFDVKFSRFPDDDDLLVIALGNVARIVPWVNINLVKVLVGERAEWPPATVELAPPELARFEGRYDSASGARFAVRAVENGLVLSAENAAAMAALAPRGDPRPANADALVEATEAIATKLAEGDLSALHAAAPPDRPMFYLDMWWRTLQTEHGEIEACRPLGLSTAPWGGATTLLALDYERGAEILKLGWSGEHVISTMIGPPYPSLMGLRPTSPTTFAHFDLFRFALAARVAFAVEGDAVTGMSLTAGDERLRLDKR
jgi:CubicO group peptidase (beta-lactamase class C family)